MADNEGSGEVMVGRTGGRPGRPRVQPLVHGGFRSNRHHEAIEQLADERGMGRDILRQSGTLYPEGLKTQGHETMMRNQPASRSGDMRTKDSPWSKGR